MPTSRCLPRKITVSIGILARNEETRLPATLASLFQQTLFTELARRGERAEIWCVANACTDDTAAVAEAFFHTQSTTHPDRAAFLARAVSIALPGKARAWNLFVHELSSRQTRYFILLDADIQLGEPATLWNLCQGLEHHAAAQVAVGEPIKDIALKARKSWRDHLSLATSRLTQGSGPQLTGQLYCIRAEAARRIRMPIDLGSCEDGYIKNLVCTDFLLKESEPARILRVPGASHIFGAYLSLSSVLRNQKRQMIGQTCLHVLVDRFLPAMCRQRGRVVDQLVQELEVEDPVWFQRLIHDHVREARHFWRLFPGICTFRFERWARRRGWEKIRQLPATLAGSVITVIAAWLAYRALRRGYLGYWPDKPPVPPASLPRGLTFAPSTS